MAKKSKDPVAEEVAEPVMPEYKVCPICGDRILAVIAKDVCDVCDWEYE